MAVTTSPGSGSSIASVADGGPRSAGSRRTIGIALYGDLTFDSRVRREATSLANHGFDVVVVCLANRSTADLPDAVRVVVSRPRADEVLPGSPNPFRARSSSPVTGAVRRLRWLRGYVANLQAWGRLVPSLVPDADAWHLNDFVALASVARHVPGHVPIVYDAHDLFLETGTALRLPGVVRSLLRRYEGRLARSVSAVITVNAGVGQVLTSRYALQRLVVVHNCPDAARRDALRTSVVREAAGIPDGAPILLHHGRMGAGRGVEQLIKALLLPGLETVHLVLMGFGEKRLDYLEIGSAEQFGGRVHLLDAVPPAVLLDWVASADIAVMPIQGSTMNLYLSTPNKLFESLAAGVPVVASDFPAMRQVVTGIGDGPLGALCQPSSPSSIADAVASLLRLPPDEMAALRQRCLRAATTTWNWETESAKLITLYEDVTTVAPTRVSADRTADQLP